MLKFGPNWFSRPQSRKKTKPPRPSVTFWDQPQQDQQPQVPPPQKTSRKKKSCLRPVEQQQQQILQQQVSWSSVDHDSQPSSFEESIFSRQNSLRTSVTSQGSCSASFAASSSSSSRRPPPPRRPARRVMADSEKEEAVNLQVEFEWVLREEVHSVLKQLHAILVECAHRFPVPLYGNEGKKQDKFVLTAAPEQLKCVVTLTGDSITHADINFKVQRQQQQTQRTTITQDYPWKIQQVQDAANHLQQAINHIDNVDSSYNFKTSDEVLHILGNILGALQRGRTSLVVPRKKPIDELMKSRNMKALSPNLPEDLAISFYIQSHKLIFVAYQLTNFQGTMKFDSCQAECSVPWLNEVLVLFTVALQLCQQLKDKISVFSQYKDFTVGSRSASALSY
ncbi:protein rogdi isoform X2 [Sabethes cyaneus]|uniref:protein rogdi isoform X2 n=1 Tax=Sabethes cyaneus TaxID=53552 RepID=UPI00237E09C1|nr:protein rogdi isoform X2 [Sabethes cyaneus]